MDEVILATLHYWANRYLEHQADGNLEQALKALRAYTRMLDWVTIDEIKAEVQP